jgi:hypothetical protein
MKPGVRTGQALLLFALAASAPSATTAQSPGEINGRVVDQSGRAVDGAQIALSPGERRAVSLEDGSFVIPGLARGDYKVSARRIGYQPASASVDVRDKPVKVTITLVPIPRVLDSIRVTAKESGVRYSAVVLDQNDLPVTGAEVVAEGIDNGIVTDSLGEFMVPHIWPGTVMLRMRKMGYRAFFRSYRVVADRTDTLRMPRLAQTLTPVEIQERSGFGMDYWAYRDLDQRTRWKGSGAGAISREELEQQGKADLCSAIPHTPGGNRFVFIPAYVCPRIYANMLIDGSHCERHHLTDFTADEVEVVEYYPGKSDVSGNMAARRCGGAAFVIWLRRAP